MKYYVTTSKDNLKYLSNKKINNVQVNSNNISFETNEKSLQNLLKDINQLSYFNRRRIKILSFIKKYIISIISIIILIIFLINEQVIIKKVQFINENTYNEEIVNYLYENNFKKRFIFYYLNDDINKINMQLKSQFYYYEWINVNKKGNILEVYIDKQDEKSYLDTTSNIKGDIVSTRDGIIRYYFIKKGVNLIKDNQSVKKGDILVSGNLLYYNNQIKYIHPLGIVLAEVVDYETITVEKVKSDFIRTGKVEIKKVFNILKKEIIPKCSFLTYDEEYITIKENKFFSIKKVIFFEVKETINYYNEDEALQYAYSYIDKEFNNKKIHKKECINDIILLSQSEDNQNYYFKCLVKKIINIAEFKAVNLEENF